MNIGKMRKTLLSFFVIIGLLGVVIFFCLQSFSNTEDHYKQRLQETGRQMSAGIELHMESSVSFVNAMAEVFSEYDDIHSAEAMSTLKRVSDNSDFTRMWLTKANGDAMSSKGVTSNATGRAYLESGLRGESGISEVQTSNVNGERNVVIYAPIYHDNTIIGLVIGIYKLDDLSKIINIECFDGEGFCDIFKQDGEIIVFSRNTKDENRKNLLLSWENSHLKNNNTAEQIKSDLEQRQDGFVISQSNKYYDYSYFCPVGINDWFVFVTLPNDVIAKDYRNNLISVLFVCANFMAVLTILLVRSFRSKSKVLQRLARTDAMTDLLNRRAIEQSIDFILKENPNEQCILMLFDIDKFKKVNDTMGHVCGDQLLKKIAELMNMEFRKIDILGRIGGDEFIIFIRDIQNEGIIINKAMEFLSKLREIKIEDYPEVEVSGSMGIAITPKDGVSFAELYEHADELMYKAKESGGDCVIVY